MYQKKLSLTCLFCISLTRFLFPAISSNFRPRRECDIDEMQGEASAAQSFWECTIFHRFADYFHDYTALDSKEDANLRMSEVKNKTRSIRFLEASFITFLDKMFRLERVIDTKKDKQENDWHKLVAKYWNSRKLQATQTELISTCELGRRRILSAIGYSHQVNSGENRFKLMHKCCSIRLCFLTFFTPSHSLFRVQLLFQNNFTHTHTFERCLSALNKAIYFKFKSKYCGK